MSKYNPPFHITEKMMNLVSEISEEIGRINVLTHGTLNPHLRKENRIRTIHSSLAIEHNSLSLKQITEVINGKRVLGNPNEIREVKNAFEAYEMMLTLNPLSIKDLLKTHETMMKGLIRENGVFRHGGVGVFEGEKLIHRAPPAKFVPDQINDLFNWYSTSQLQPLIRSAIFHYEFEFIHPFADGNGRMGRMWHSLLLGQWKEIFYWLPIEDLIRLRQSEYYDALGKADRDADSAVFVELMLEIILDTVKEIVVVDEGENNKSTVNESVQKLLEVMGNESLPLIEIMRRLNLSHKPTFRKNYLLPALNLQLIEMTIPDKPNSRNQKYRRRT